jgi:type I restriction enzyme M protein
VLQEMPFSGSGNNVLTQIVFRPMNAKETLAHLEDRLWKAADQFLANTDLTPKEYSTPVLGMIFLVFADHKFTQAKEKLEGKSTGRRTIGKEDYQAKGILYLPEKSRFSNLINLPEGTDLGKALKDAMDAIETENPDLKGILPKTYQRIDNSVLAELLRLMDSIPRNLEGDSFGLIYEYFLGSFAMKEGQLGGEFFTPSAIVRLMVEIMEPFGGTIFDPACGSGGMFVQSARFIERHRDNPLKLTIYGQEKTLATAHLCKMNLAINGLSGDVLVGNSYYEDLHKAAGKFDFVMANPPFNVNGVDKDRLKDDRRYPLGLPNTDNGNYLWINLFYACLNAKGRAAFVMANSASDARSSEATIREKLIREKAVDVVVAVGPNMFYTVTLPVTLWFLDRGKKGIKREDQILFIDARNIYRQINRRLRDFTSDQIEFLSNIVRLYRGKPIETDGGSKKLMQEHFPKGKYVNVPGLCKVATLAEVEAQGWSLNPGRYVGVTDTGTDDGDFYERLAVLNIEFLELTAQARELEGTIQMNLETIINAA